jgi:hypothetical protein
MTEQSDPCQTPEILITIAVNPCHCDDAVIPSPVEEIPSVPTTPEITPILVAEPIAVVETPVPEVPPTPIETPISPTAPEVVPVPDPVTPPVEVTPIPVTETVPVVEAPPTQPVIETLIPPIPVPVEVAPTPNPVITPAIPPVAPIPPEVVVPIVQIPIPIPPEVYPCDCILTSTLKLAEFANTLRTALNGLLYPSESDFPVEVISSGLSTKMTPGAEVRSLERVFPQSLRQVDPDDQQTGNAERAAIAAKWQAVYSLIKRHSITTVWHYRVRKKSYTHEQMVIMLHPQGAVGLRIKLVET